jgi:hypothetical protein
MVLESTQPVTEMSTRNIRGGGGGKGMSARKADNLAASCEPIVKKMWDPRCLTTPWAFTASYRNNFTFLAFTIHYIPKGTILQYIFILHRITNFYSKFLYSPNYKFLHSNAGTYSGIL